MTNHQRASATFLNKHTNIDHQLNASSFRNPLLYIPRNLFPCLVESLHILLDRTSACAPGRENAEFPTKSPVGVSTVDRSDLFPKRRFYLVNFLGLQQTNLQKVSHGRKHVDSFQGIPPGHHPLWQPPRDRPDNRSEQPNFE